MITQKSIIEYSNKIAREFNPETIILFGSYAKNSVNIDSDVDILVIMDYPGKAVEQTYKIRKKIQAKFSVDLIVRKREIIEERIKDGDFFFEEILKEGKVLYDRFS
ncbi:MAG: nucleotidyltransferase domain-containing protein [Ignavibacteriaceae bacterium]